MKTIKRAFSLIFLFSLLGISSCNNNNGIQTVPLNKVIKINESTKANKEILQKIYDKKYKGVYTYESRLVGEDNPSYHISVCGDDEYYGKRNIANSHDDVYINKDGYSLKINLAKGVYFEDNSWENDTDLEDLADNYQLFERMEALPDFTISQEDGITTFTWEDRMVMKYNDDYELIEEKIITLDGTITQKLIEKTEDTREFIDYYLDLKNNLKRVDNIHDAV